MRTEIKNLGGGLNLIGILMSGLSQGDFLSKPNNSIPRYI